MSDYEVTLVNDCMQEFYVHFYGPAESESDQYPVVSHLANITSHRSTLCWRRVENPRRIARPVPLQITQHWLHEQDLSSEY